MRQFAMGMFCGVAVALAVGMGVAIDPPSSVFTGFWSEDPTAQRAAMNRWDEETRAEPDPWIRWIKWGSGQDMAQRAGKAYAARRYLVSRGIDPDTMRPEAAFRRVEEDANAHLRKIAQEISSRAYQRFRDADVNPASLTPEQLATLQKTMSDAITQQLADDSRLYNPDGSERLPYEHSPPIGFISISLKFDGLDVLFVEDE